MDSLDKLYSKYISSNRQIEHHPIIDLFLIRTDKNYLPKIPEDSLEFHYFSDLPIIPLNQLSNLYKKLITTSLHDAFSDYLEIMNYNPNLFKDLIKLKMKVHINLIAEKLATAETENIPEYLGQHYVVSVFFCLLMFILNSNDNDQITFKILQLYTEELESFGALNPPFSSINSYLYSKFIEKFVLSNQFKFDNDSIDLISHHILNDTSLDYHFSSVYLKFVQRVSDQFTLNQKSEKTRHGLNIHGVNQLLDTLSAVIDLKKTCLSVANYQKLAMILVPFISDLNLHAVKVLVNLSLNHNNSETDLKKGNKPPSIKDSFILLPQLLLKKLQKIETKPFNCSEDFPHFPDSIFEISIENSDDFFNYVSNKPYMLEDGFNPITFNPMPLKELLNEYFSDFLLNFSNALKKSSGLCIDNFFMAMFKLLNALEGSNEFYYDLLITALFIATSCVETISLMSLYDMFHRKTIFYPEFTIFDMITNTKQSNSITSNNEINSTNLNNDQSNSTSTNAITTPNNTEAIQNGDRNSIQNNNGNNNENANAISDQNSNTNNSTILSKIDLNDVASYQFDSNSQQNHSNTINANINTVNETNKVMSIRFHILNLFACQMDQLLPQFLNSAIKYPFLFTEEVAFVSSVNQINLQVFMTKEFLVSIFTVIKALIKEYFSNLELKEKSFLALQTVLSFLFKLLSNNTIIEQFFLSSYFITNFFQLVFVDFLKLFILSTTQNFLLNLNTPDSTTFPVIIRNVTTYFTHLFLKLNHIEFENKNQTIIDINKCLMTSLSMNMKISPFFSNVLDAFLSLTPNFPELLTMSLRFLSIVNLVNNEKLSSQQLRLVLKMIRKIDGVNPSQATKVSLLNLCSASVTLNLNSLFLIQRPSMIPLMLIAFSESDYLLEILKIFEDLYDYSLSNCYAIHESGLKQILLKFIYKKLIKNSSLIKFRGIQFNLKLNENDIYTTIFPFLYKMIKISTNNAELFYLNKFINQFDNRKLALKTGFFILDLLVDAKTQVAPIFPIGFSKSPVSIKNLNPNLINKSFLFLTWLKVDHPINIKINTSIPILTITDQSKKNKKNYKKNVFCLFVNRGLLFYQFNDYVEQICAKIPSNEWFFIGFVCQRSTQQLSCIALFSELNMGYCQDVPAIYFPPDSILKIKIGGASLSDSPKENLTKNILIDCINEDLPILMGPFALLNRMVDEDFLHNVEKQGPSSINLIPNDFLVMKNTEALDSNLKIKTQKISVFENLKLNKFENMFCLNELNLIKLMEVFIKLDKAPSDLCNLILAILKECFDISVEMQINFSSIFGILRKYFMKYARDKANFELYKIFYSILEIVQSIDTMHAIFDNFLINVELYSNGPPSSFEKIVHHWSTTLIKRYPALFKRNHYFNRLIKMYVYLFNKKTYDERYSIKKKDQIRMHFCNLLVAASKLGLNNENISYFENFINIQTDNLLTFLQILEQNMSSLKINKDYQLTLHHFAENENLEISKIAIKCIHQLTRPNWIKPMMALAIQLKSKINDQKTKTDLINFLLDQITEYPGFIHLIAALTVYFNENEKQIIGSKLCEIFNVTATNTNSNSNRISEILNEKFWFIWLLRTAIHTTGNVQLNFLTIMSFFLFYVDDLQSELNSIINVLQIFEAVDKTFDYYQVLLDLFVNVNAVSMMNSRYLIIPLLRSLFFKYAEVSYSNEIIEMFENGPFSNDYNVFVNHLNINVRKCNNQIEFDILSLENLLNQDFGNYKLLFSYSVQIGNTVTEGKLANFLIQLIESNNIDLNMSAANQIINTILQNNNSIGAETDLIPNLSDITTQIIELSGDVLIDFAKYMLDKDNLNENAKIENLLKINKLFPKIQNDYHNFFLKQLYECLVEIKDIIKDIKKLVFIDFESVKRNSIEILKNSEHVSEFAKKVAKDEIRKFASVFDKFNKNSKQTMCRDSNLLLSYCPCKLQRIPDKIDISDLLKSKSTTVSKTKSSTVSYKIKLFEFGVEQQGLVVVQQDLIKLFESASSDDQNYQNLIEKVQYNKVDLVIVREKVSIEIFTSKNGSFYFEFYNEEDCLQMAAIMTDRFLNLNKLFVISKNKSTILQSNSNIKAIRNIFQLFDTTKYTTTGYPITNFEYLMFLNYFSGYSYHKNGKKPRLPLNNSPVSALQFFLPDFKSAEHADLNITPQQVYEYRTKLELSDIQQLAKKKYPVFVPKPNSIVFTPQPIQQTLYRDLKLEHDQILTGGFVSSNFHDNSIVFIITKTGEVHFVEILKNKLKHVKTFNSDFLNEICKETTKQDELTNLSIVKTTDGFLAIYHKMCQRYTPLYESPISETRIDPHLIAIDGNEMVYVSNECDICKLISIEKSSISLAPNHSTPLMNTNSSMSSLMPISTSPLLVNSNNNQQTESDLINSMELLYSSESTITCMAISSKFDIIAYGTEKCQIIVNSLNSTKTRHSIINITLNNSETNSIIVNELNDHNSVSNDDSLFNHAHGNSNNQQVSIEDDHNSLIYIGNEPQKVLITSGFGFIVSEAQKFIFVHTINGSFIGSIQIENSIIDWFAFMNSKCQDFIIFIDKENQIGIFEVSKMPNKIKFIQSRPGTNAITYISELQCIVAFSKNDGVLTLYPLSLENFICD